MLLPDLSQVRIAVLGDVMLDRYIEGRAERISPEAPVPVVRVENERLVAGGAANVAANIVSLGGQAALIGLVGNDAAAHQLRDLTIALGVNAVLLHDLPVTVVKSRVMAGRQQLVRFDQEDLNFMLSSQQEAEILRNLAHQLSGTTCLLISDYAKGMLTEELCAEAIEMANAAGIPVVVDPKHSNWARYAKADLITPNLKELAEAVGRPVMNTDADVVAAAHQLIVKYGLKSILVTRSECGISHITMQTAKHAATSTREVFDVTGAGDTVLAVIGLLFSTKLPWAERLHVANCAAGLAVGKVGTAVIGTQELSTALISSHMATGALHWNQLSIKVAEYRTQCQSIVFTNGCFDVLHRGHVTLLEQAKTLGDVLVVGLNSDDSVKRLKGPSRPINSLIDRAFVLSALACVDHVVAFGEDTPAHLIAMVQPDVLVKGGDYKLEDVVGRENAGRTVIIDLVEGFSSTGTINKLKET